MRFRLAYNDTVRAYLYNSKGQIIATLYDSGYTTIKQVETALLKKVPYYSGKRIDVSTANDTKGTYKMYKRTVNQN